MTISAVVAATRYHDISCGHRVVGHEGKCTLLHGHNYRVHFNCVPEKELDNIGRVIDFGVIKSKLCMWLEDNWDHKFIAWTDDLVILDIMQNLPSPETSVVFRESIIWVPFNPTAENMALYLLNVIGPQQLEGTGVRLDYVRIDETRKCSAEATRYG